MLFILGLKIIFIEQKGKLFDFDNISYSNKIFYLNNISCGDKMQVHSLLSVQL